MVCSFCMEPGYPANRCDKNLHRDTRCSKSHHLDRSESTCWAKGRSGSDEGQRISFVIVVFEPRTELKLYNNENQAAGTEIVITENIGHNDEDVITAMRCFAKTEALNRQPSHDQYIVMQDQNAVPVLARVPLGAARVSVKYQKSHDRWTKKKRKMSRKNRSKKRTATADV